MDNLFILYRYLVQNKHLTDEQNPYNIALRALNPLLDMVRTLEYYGNELRSRGGLDWQDAEHIQKCVIEGYYVGLFEHHDGSVRDAILDMVKQYLKLEDFAFLLDEIKKEGELEARRLEQLGEIEFEHPF